LNILQQKRNWKVCKFWVPTNDIDAMFRIQFEQQRIKDSLSRLDQMKKSRANQEQSKHQAVEEHENLIRNSADLEKQLAKMQESLDSLKSKLNEQGNVLIEAKKKIDEWIAQNEDVSRNISKLEAQIELLVGDRVALIRKCKLEEISLPLADDNSLDDISLEQLDVFFVN
jgi:structural maintenance of chromosome 1